MNPADVPEGGFSYETGDVAEESLQPLSNEAEGTVRKMLFIYRLKQ
jgi:hypothetical protein